MVTLATRNQPCRQFASTGTCSYQNCKFSHEGPSNAPTSSFTPTAGGPKPACTFFQRHGTCRFGPSCKFSHDVNAPSPPAEDPNSAVSLYRGWSQLLGNPRTRGGGAGFASRGVPQDLTADQMERFLGDGIRILDIGSIETVQQLIRGLGSDQGLYRIRQVVEAEFAAGYSVSSLSFKRHAVPFLRILSHDELRVSLVLEKEVGTIFNFIYAGRRATTFFTHVVQNLEALSQSGEPDFVENALFAASLALFNTLNLNQGAAVQEDFRNIVLALEKLRPRANPGTNANSFVSRSTQHEIGRIKTLLKIADSLPTALIPKRAEVISARVDRTFVDFPGELSREGPRHDNDHTEIAKIKVLPTSEEINSHRNEFLPQRSPDYPHHLEGISRVLDFQFRLLREDTSGQIREAVRSTINNWDELVGVKDAKKYKSKAYGVRTIIYQDAQIENVRCSNRDGIILTVSFIQPVKVQALKASAREEWWERSKCLAIGSLLCILDGLKRVTFLVVCERKVIGTKQKRSASTGQPHEDLASDQYRAYITLRFAEAITEADVGNVFQPKDSGGSQVLVEFPGLLFASFDPVLRSLQQISKDGNLPFPHWLAPSKEFEYTVDPRSSRFVDVPPPLYMTKPGVKLRLKSITGGLDLNYSITGGLETVDLERTTTLDHGQCEALLASLSRELALIQGPPGTGKSYLGVQIVKVLLENRDQTEIGPIICV